MKIHLLPVQSYKYARTVRCGGNGSLLRVGGRTKAEPTAADRRQGDQTPLVDALPSREGDTLAAG